MRKFTSTSKRPLNYTPSSESIAVFANTTGLDKLKTGSRVTLTGTVEGKRGSGVLVSSCVL